MRVVSRHHVQIAVTHSVGHEPDEDLVRSGLEHLHVFDRERLVHLV
jgi:hypothetical protein